MRPWPTRSSCAQSARSKCWSGSPRRKRAACWSGWRPVHRGIGSPRTPRRRWRESSKRFSMKITRVETHVCHARMRNWIFVKVGTDQDGLVGWGEATLEWHTRAIVGAIEDLNQLLVGEDPTRVEHLWQMMYRQHFWHGHGIVRSTAVAGIDLALWDILGKSLGVPCSKLWGGPVRDHVRTYCHLGGGRMEDFYETAADDAKRFADLARKAVEDGFTAFKCMAVPPTLPLDGLKP